jgi:carotenoid cleavage dioxygenase-like enzyme
LNSVTCMELCPLGHHVVHGMHFQCSMTYSLVSSAFIWAMSVRCGASHRPVLARFHEIFTKNHSWLCSSDSSCNSRLGLLKRAAPQDGVTRFEVDPFVCFHTGAAWEDGSKVHLVAARCIASILMFCTFQAPFLSSFSKIQKSNLLLTFQV